MTRPQLVLVVSIAALLSTSGVARAAPPVALEAQSPFCETGLSIYRRGAVLYCAAPDPHWPEPMTYSVSGDRADRYTSTIADAIQLGACLSGRRFQKTEHGSLVFDITAHPVGQTPSSSSNSFFGKDEGATRTGYASVWVDHASQHAVGTALQDAVRRYLGITPPADGAFARVVHAARVAGDAKLTLYRDGGRYCDSEHVLVARGGVTFCAPEAPAWRKTTGYAVLGNEHAYDDTIATAAAFAGDLAGSTTSVSRTPEFVVVLTSGDVDTARLSELARRAQVELRTPILDYFRKFDASQIVGSSQWAGGHGKRVGSAVIMVRDREPAKIKADIGSYFLEEFGIERARDLPPRACADR